MILICVLCFVWCTFMYVCVRMGCWRQISANSVYGFTGATVGQLPCVPIASSVTAYGRNLLLDTRTFVESTYTIANGFPYNADVSFVVSCNCFETRLQLLRRLLCLSLPQLSSWQ